MGMRGAHGPSKAVGTSSHALAPPRANQHPFLTTLLIHHLPFLLGVVLGNSFGRQIRPKAEFPAA